jgi:hypothetical protein
MTYEERLTKRTIELHDRECSGMGAGCDISTMGRWRTMAEAEFAKKDREALDFIEAALDGTEWGADHLDVVATAVVGTGRQIRNPDEMPMECYFCGKTEESDPDHDFEGCADKATRT